MKKLIALTLAFVLVFALCACGGGDAADSKYAGTWKATSADMSGISADVETILGGEFKFVLKAGGKCELVIAGESDSGSWKETDGGFEVEDEYEFEVDGDTATMEYEGISFIFEKQ